MDGRECICGFMMRMIDCADEKELEVWNWDTRLSIMMMNVIL